MLVLCNLYLRVSHVTCHVSRVTCHGSLVVAEELHQQVEAWLLRLMVFRVRLLVDAQHFLPNLKLVILFHYLKRYRICIIKQIDYMVLNVF